MPTPQYVIDTSIIVKWYLPEPDSNVAARLLSKLLLGQINIHVPTLAQLELANALFYSKLLNSDQIMDTMKMYLGLKLENIPLNHHLLEQTINNMVAFKLAAYDACFLALAQLLDIPLITADTKHHQKQFSPLIRYLEDL